MGMGRELEATSEKVNASECGRTETEVAPFFGVRELLATRSGNQANRNGH
jgi:hypothetical protein